VRRDGPVRQEAVLKQTLFILKSTCTHLKRRGELQPLPAGNDGGVFRAHAPIDEAAILDRRIIEDVRLLREASAVVIVDKLIERDNHHSRPSLSWPSVQNVLPSFRKTG